MLKTLSSVWVWRHPILRRPKSSKRLPVETTYVQPSNMCVSSNGTSRQHRVFGYHMLSWYLHAICGASINITLRLSFIRRGKFWESYGSLNANARARRAREDRKLNRLPEYTKKKCYSRLLIYVVQLSFQLAAQRTAQVAAGFAVDYRRSIEPRALRRNQICERCTLEHENHVRCAIP